MNIIQEPVGLERGINDWKVGEMKNLFALSEEQKMNSREEDSIVSKLAKDGKFSTKLCYSLIFPTRGQCGVKFWERYIPPRINFFVWESWWVKLLTLDNLRRKCMMLFVPRR